MAGEVKVPGVGPVPKKYIGIGAVILAAILAVAYYRHSKAQAVPATTPSAGSAAFDAGFTGGVPDLAENDPYPPDGTVGDPTDPNSTDPATGATYGDEQSGYGTTAGGGSYQGPFPGGGSGNQGGGPPFASNAAWAQAAEAELTANGSSATVVQVALGRYLNGQAVSKAQQNVIDAATGLEGEPPVAGKDGFPPAIRLVAGHPGSGGGGGKVKVPDVQGELYDAAATRLHAAGLVAKRGVKDVGHVTRQSPAAGTSVKKGSAVTLFGTGK
jgi:PASTA domain